MGLFGGGNSRTTRNTSNTSTVNDNRIGASENAQVYSARDGSSISVSNTTNVTDHGSVSAALDAVEAGTANITNAVDELGDNAENLGTSAIDGGVEIASDAIDLVDEADKRRSDDFQLAVGAIGQSAYDAISAVETGARRSLDFGLDVIDRSQDQTARLTTILADTFADTSEKFSDDISEDRKFLTSTLDKALAQTRSSEERGLTNVLDTVQTLFIAMAVVMAGVFIIPRFAKG